MKAILDTSVVIGNAHDNLEGQLAISAVTMAELHFGVLVAANSVERAVRLKRLLNVGRSFDPLPVDDAVAESYGAIAAAVVDVGRQPRRRTMDLLIAATAHVHGAQLYTSNPHDFRGLDSFIKVVAV